MKTPISQRTAKTNAKGFNEHFLANNPPPKLTHTDQLFAAEKQLQELRLDRLNLGCTISIYQDELVKTDKNILGLEASIHALKILQSLPTQNH